MTAERGAKRAPLGPGRKGGRPGARGRAPSGAGQGGVRPTIGGKARRDEEIDLSGDPFDALARLSPAGRARFIDRADDDLLADIDDDWQLWAHNKRRPKDDAWKVWVMMAGRGFGKTRTGAEWVNALASRHGDLRIALVAASMAEAWSVMVEGHSGILARALPGE